MMMTSLQFSAFLLLVGLYLAGCEDACYKDGSCEKQDTSSSVYKRYLLYDVNPGEGFNLRRDVYMRVAVAVARLHGWTLVLPPWGPLYHWQATNGEYETGISWARFFDVASLNRYVPVMEFDDYVKESGARVDAVLHLQNYAEGWRDGHFDEKWHVRPCLSQPVRWRVQRPDVEPRDATGGQLQLRLHPGHLQDADGDVCRPTAQVYPGGPRRDGATPPLRRPPVLGGPAQYAVRPTPGGGSGGPAPRPAGL